jgi:L-fuculose-phosphate aldolase
MRAGAERRAIVQWCRTLAGQGYFAATGGNLALRVDDRHFAVTPSATDYYEMIPEDVSVLRLSDLEQIEGSRPPSVESGLHARVLRARRDCGCSLHTHQPVASACALLGTALPVDDPRDRSLLGARVAAVGYAPSGTAWLAARLAGALRADVNAYLMRNHGALCCAPDVQTAAQAVGALEAVAARWLARRIAARTPPVARSAELQRILDETARRAMPAPHAPSIAEARPDAAALP